jgi:hypothetical protein
VNILVKKSLAQASFLLEQMVRCVKKAQHLEKRLDCYHNLVILLRTESTQSYKAWL